MLPFFGQVIQRKNRGDRADRNARPTIDALYGIDVELRNLIEARTGVVVRRVLLGWMQSTGQASTQAVSFVPMQGSAITKAISHLRLSEPTIRPRGEEVQAGGIAFGFRSGCKGLNS